MRKNPHAVALGRKGGQAYAKLPAAERSRVGRLGGRPLKYRILDGALQRREGDLWLTLEAPLDRPAREALRRLRS